MQKAWIGALALVAALIIQGPAVAAEIVSLDSPGLVGIRSAGFTLDREATIGIEAVGRESDGDGFSWGGNDDGNWFSFGDNDGDDLTAYAWILDADTRSVVWDMDVRDTDRGELGDLVEFSGSVDLPAGRYELYLTSNHAGLLNAKDGDWSRRSMRRRIEEIEEDVTHLSVSLTSDVRATTFTPDGVREASVVAITAVGDSE
ncbi:hypothetical protein DRQ32_04085, partial [bacterium]